MTEQKIAVNQYQQGHTATPVHFYIKQTIKHKATHLQVKSNNNNNNNGKKTAIPVQFDMKQSIKHKAIHADYKQINKNTITKKLHLYRLWLTVVDVHKTVYTAVDALGTQVDTEADGEIGSNE